MSFLVLYKVRLSNHPVFPCPCACVRACVRACVCVWGVGGWGGEGGYIIFMLFSIKIIIISLCLRDLQMIALIVSTPFMHCYVFV